ncbi:619_t:CDS:2, partial [Cetraspora pellucida]
MLKPEEHTDQDHANSDSEEKLELNIIVSSSSKASSKLDKLLNELSIEDNHTTTLKPFKVPIQEAHNALKTWITFFEQQQSSNFNMNNIKIFKKYDKM